MVIRELKGRNGRYGLVTMCVGGGMGAAGIFRKALTTKDTKVHKGNPHEITVVGDSFVDLRVLRG